MLMEIQAKHHSTASKCQRSKISYNKKKCITQYQHIFACHAKRPLNLIYFFESTWTLYILAQPTHLRYNKKINFKISWKTKNKNNSIQIKSSSVRSIAIAEQSLDLQGRVQSTNHFQFLKSSKTKPKELTIIYLNPN